MRNVATLLCAMLLLAGCGGSRIVREEPAKLQDFTAGRQVKEVWSVDIGASAVKKGVILSPYLDGNVIYTADPKGHVRAFAADSGRHLWRVNIKKPVTGATAEGDGLVVLATKDGEVVALDKTDGHRIWTSSVSSEVLAPAVIHDDVVVVQSVDGRLAGLSAKDGKRLWMYERLEPALSLYGTATPVAEQSNVITGFASGKIVAVQISDGKPVWEMSVAQPHGRNEVERLVDVDASPVMVGKMLFAASYHGKIIAVDIPSGHILWSRDVSTYTGMDADDKNVYLTDADGEVIAYDQRTGASVWKQVHLRARGLNAPRYMDGLVAVGDFEGYVHWLSSDDGHFVARYRVSHSPIRSRVLYGQGLAYVSSQSGNLEALRLENKSP
ncbi:MAG: outer membrane protein assembly factor BamB [Sulfuricaulis sp.]